VGYLRRTTLALVVTAGVVAFVVWVVWRINSSKDPVNTANVLAGYLAAVALGVTLLMALGTWWWKGVRAAPEVGAMAQAAAVADRLAEVVADKWREEAKRRRIITPASATVRWRWAADDISGTRSEVTVPPAPGTGPPPLPDLGKQGELLGTGEVIRLHDEVYARLPHGRLVLLGGPGSGKTGAMILLLLAGLDHRARLTSNQRDRVPVPVWLTLSKWNPATTTLREWAVVTMNRDYPHLRAAVYGPDAAGELLRRSRVALFLDGLDEMPGGAREQALQRIDDETQGLRIVVTSRPEEYQQSLQASQPDNTAVIELRPVRPKQAAEYLLHGRTGLSRQRWEQVCAYLTQDPASPAAQALDNPLALSLARDTYTDQDLTGTRKDPAELTDPDRWNTAEEVCEYLFDRFLTTAYPDEAQRVHATRWLSWIAYNMGTSRDLSWWDIPTWIPRWKLRLTRGIVSGITIALTLAVTAALATGVGYGLADLAYGFGIGLVFGIAIPLRTKPAVARMLVGRRRQLPARYLLAGLAAGPVIGWLSWVGGDGIAGSIATALIAGGLFGLAFRHWPRFGLRFAGAPRMLVLRWPRRQELRPFLLIGFLCFPLLIPALLAMWATPIADTPSASAASIYRADRRTSMIYGLIYGLSFGLIGIKPGLDASHRIGTVSGITAGIVFAFGVLLVAWLAAGQVPLLKLSELFLNRQLSNRIKFLNLLEYALDREVLRQAGSVYQFRHAALQMHLARMHRRPAMNEAAGRSPRH
jgi:hypothetical protein